VDQRSVRLISEVVRDILGVVDWRKSENEAGETSYDAARENLDRCGVVEVCTSPGAL